MTGKVRIGHWAAVLLLIASCEEEAGKPAVSSPAESPVQSQPTTLASEEQTQTVSSPFTPNRPVGVPGVDTEDQVPVFEPLRDARAGEQAVYTSLGGRDVLYQIIETDAFRVTVRVAVFEGTQWVGLPATYERKREYDPLAVQASRQEAARSSRTGSLDLAGRSWTALIYEDRWVDEEVPYLRRSWVSPEAPVFGMLKMELYGDGELEARLVLNSYRADRPDG